MEKACVLLVDYRENICKETDLKDNWMPLTGFGNETVHYTVCYRSWLGYIIKQQACHD